MERDTYVWHSGISTHRNITVFTQGGRIRGWHYYIAVECIHWLGGNYVNGRKQNRKQEEYISYHFSRIQLDVTQL